MKKVLTKHILLLNCIFFIYADNLSAQTRICVDFSTSVTNTANSITVNNPSPLPSGGAYSADIVYTNDNGIGLHTVPTFTNAVLTQNGSGFVISLPGGTLPLDATVRERFMMTISDGTSSYLLDLNFGQCNTVLPLTLISFTASSNSPSGYVTLSWVTAQESNTSHFLVQRSTDGISWSSHGIEPAAGFSSIQLTYNFVTPMPNLGTRYYYRLQMIDLDGRFTYSPVVTVRGSGSGNPASFCNYTNIEGAASSCSGTNVFKVHNAAPGQSWSTTTGTFSVTNGGTVATLTGCISGSATVTASSAGCTKSKTITGCSLGAISGAAGFCTTGNYSVSNPGGAPLTWSVSPSGIASINCTNCNPVTLSKLGDGQVTLTASISGCSGTPITVSTSIAVGNVVLPLTGTYSTATNTKPLMTVNFVPVGNIYTQFQWPGMTNITSALASGSPSGTGFYSYGNMFSFNIAQYQAVSVNITGTGACGQSMATRTFVQSSYTYSMTVSPNPSKNNIHVGITKVLDTSAAALANITKLALTQKGAGITRIYLYDFYSNIIVKQWKYEETGSTDYNLNIADVKKGVYLLKLERDNKITTTKIIVQ